MRNGISSGLQRPSYYLLLPYFVLQTELPMGCKVMKFTKFAGDIEESIVRHVVRYQTEFSYKKCVNVVYDATTTIRPNVDAIREIIP